MRSEARRSNAALVQTRSQTRRKCLYAATALVLLTGCAMREAEIESSARRMLAEQAEAWNRGDVEAFMQHYWKSEALTFSSSGQTRHGWNATLERYRRRYPTREKMGTLTFQIEQVQSLGSASAFVLGRWHLERDEPIGGNFTLILRRIGGVWRIVHDHTSTRDAKSATGA